MKDLFSDVHWSLVLLTGIVVVILIVVLNTVSLLLATYMWNQPNQAQIAIQVSSWSTYILLMLLTFGGAVWVARKVEREAPLHGFLVGLVAALILFIINPDVTNFFQGAFRGRLDLLVFVVGTFFLTIAAGWLGGFLGR